MGEPTRGSCVTVCITPSTYPSHWSRYSVPDSPAQTIDQTAIGQTNTDQSDVKPLALVEAPSPSRPLCLLLDFDGTLAEIGHTPDAVAVDDAMAEALIQAALRLEGRIAIISGRSLEQLDALLPPAMASWVIAASHGQELRIGGVVQAPDRTGIFADLAFEATLHFQHDTKVVIEEKTFGLGLHYRLAPALRKEVESWTMIQAAEHDLAVQHGDMVYELRPRGVDKGDAVREIMALAAFDGSCPIYIGDDLTDIPAFQAAQALGGRAISVGPRTAGHSDQQLDDVAGVRALIAEIAA